MFSISLNEDECIDLLYAIEVVKKLDNVDVTNLRRVRSRLLNSMRSNS